MSEQDKEKVTIEDLPVPLTELNPEELDEVTGGIGSLNPIHAPNPNPGLINPGLIKKPNEDSY